MKCSMCNREITINDKFCNHCGENNEFYIESKPVNDDSKYTSSQRPLYQVRTNSSNEESLSGWAGVFSFLFPIVGLVLYFVYKEDKPAAAKQALVIAIISFVIGFFIWL